MMSKRTNNPSDSIGTRRVRSGGRNGSDPLGRKSRAEPRPPDGTSFPKVLSQLESDYMQVKQTDKLLHKQLSQWFEHMEDWMHYQKHMYVQMHERCQQLGLHEDSGYSNGGASISSLDYSQEKKQFAPKLPHAAMMKPVPAEDTAPPPLLPHNSAQPVFHAVQAKELQNDVLYEQDLLEPAANSVEGICIDLPQSRVRQPSLTSQQDPDDVTASMLLEAQEYEKEEARHRGSGCILEVLNPADMEQHEETRNLVDLTPRASDIENSVAFSSASPRPSMFPRGSFSKRATFAVPSNGRLGMRTTEPDFDWENAEFADMPFEQLPPEMQMWCDIVDALLYSAEKKKMYELREAWKQNETFVQREMRKNDNLDLRITTVVPRGTRKGTSIVQGTRQSIQHHLMTHTTSDMSANGLNFGRIATTRQLGQCRASCLVMDPQSPQRLLWMSIGMVLMVYDLIVLPLQAFEMEDHQVMTGVQWFGQIFWTCDILVTFLTGVYVNSELRTDMKTISRVYATSWLPFDLAVVLPLWAAEILGGDGDGAENASAFKLLRMMRFLRLARMAKFEHYLQEALASVNSSYLILLVGILKLMTAMIILSHLNACIWYAVGNSVNGGWSDRYADTDIFYKYLTAMHWAFTQFQGTSEITPGVGGKRHTGERAYAVFVVMCSLIILATFVSTLTNMMMQLQALREEKVGMARRVRSYLSDSAISKQLSVRVKKYIDWKQRMQRQGVQSSEILDMLPPVLQLDLQEEVRGPLINMHKFFSAIQATHARVFRQICHEVLRPMAPAPGEMIFNQQDKCIQMFFVVSGTPKYIHMPTGLQATRHQSTAHKSTFGDLLLSERLHDAAHDAEAHDSLERVFSMGTGDYCCEPILWTHWEYCGRLAGTEETASSFLVLPAAEFASTMQTHPPAHVSAIFYARRFVAGLNRFGKMYHDIIDISMMAAEEMDDD